MNHFEHFTMKFGKYHIQFRSQREMERRNINNLVSQNIKNKRDFVEIFGLQGGYCFFLNRFILPPLREINFCFIREVLREEKHLLKVDRLPNTYLPPRLREYSVSQLWNTVRDNPLISRYFPEYGDRTPSKSYFFKVFIGLTQVMNILSPGYSQNLMDMIKERRTLNQPEDDIIDLSEQMAQYIARNEPCHIGRQQKVTKLIRRGREDALRSTRCSHL